MKKASIFKILYLRFFVLKGVKGGGFIACEMVNLTKKMDFLDEGGGDFKTCGKVNLTDR